MDYTLRQSVVLGLALSFSYLPHTLSACTLKFTSPSNGSTVKQQTITVYGQGGADVSAGDHGTVKATVNGKPFLNYSGSFSRATSFLRYRGVSVTLQPGINFLQVTGGAGSCSASDSMTIMYDPEVELSKNKGKPNNPGCGPSSAKGNPINIAIGNKFQQVVDFSLNGNFPLIFSRFYNSVDGNWRHSYSTHLKINSNKATLVFSDGKESVFTLSGTTATANTSELGVLKKENNQWVYYATNRIKYAFNDNGRLAQLTNPQGSTQTLSYQDKQITVQGEQGQQLILTEDEHYQPVSLSAKGQQWAYEYNTRHQLITVTHTLANSTVKTKRYHYEDSRFPTFLTGITDENGVRFVSWTYDERGRANSSEHAGGKERTEISYNADGTVTETNALGKKTIYHFGVFDGVKRITAIDGEATANCSASNSRFEYSAKGLLTQKIDNKGVKTSYQYNAQGLQIEKVEAVDTPQARTTTTEWDTEKRLPLKTSDGQLETLYQYDEKGQLTSKTHQIIQ